MGKTHYINIILIASLMFLSACGKYQAKSITASLGKEKTAALTGNDNQEAQTAATNSKECGEPQTDYETLYAPVLEDISGDSIPELLIGQNADYDYDDIGEQSYIYSIFSLKDKEIVFVIDGYKTELLTWTPLGNFESSGMVSEGSSGSDQDEKAVP